MLTLKPVHNAPECSGNVVALPIGQTVSTAADLMLRHGVGCLVAVNSNEQIAGIVSEQDIVRKVVAPRLDPASTLVGDIATRNVIACTTRTELSKVESIMAQRHIRHVPIVENGQLKGMISSRDLMRQQLVHAHELLRRQGELLEEIERRHPGITHTRRDGSGRIVM